MVKITKSLTLQQIQSHRNQFVNIYREAFSAPPYCKKEDEVFDFAQSLPHHVEKAGFEMAVAFEKQSEAIIGFAYGYTNRPDELFQQEVAKAVHPDSVRDWLVNSFRLVEMAVRPDAQGQGIGGALHDSLLRGLSYEKAVLATMAAETKAYKLYRKRGWRVLLEEIYFPNVPRPYRIMGFELAK